MGHTRTLAPYEAPSVADDDDNDEADIDDDNDGLDDALEEDEVCFLCGQTLDRCECVS